LKTKPNLVEKLLEMMVSQPKDVRDELQRADVQMLQMQIDRLETRRGFWRARLSELEGETPTS